MHLGKLSKRIIMNGSPYFWNEIARFHVRVILHEMAIVVTKSRNVVHSDLQDCGHVIVNFCVWPSLVFVLHILGL